MGPKGFPLKSISSPATITRTPLLASIITNIHNFFIEKLSFIYSHNVATISKQAVCLTLMAQALSESRSHHATQPFHCHNAYINSWFKNFNLLLWQNERAVLT